MVRATRVAVATASSNGTMKDRSRPVSSIISTTVEIGPCVVAARTAAAPQQGEQSGRHTRPEPGPGMPQHSAEQCAYRKGRREQAAGRAAADAEHGRHGSERQQYQKRRWRYLVREGKLRDVLPLPSNCGKGIETAPSSPSTSTGNASRRQPSGLLRSAQVTART
jgi:hypothetical protein